MLTGTDEYSLGGWAGAESWKCWPEASATGIGACGGGGSMTSGRAGRGAAAAAGTSPGPGSGIKAASGPGGALGRWARRHPVWERGRSSLSKSCQIPEEGGGYISEYELAFPEMAWDMGYLTHLCFHPHLFKPTKAEWTLREKQSWTTWCSGSAMLTGR